MSIYKKLEEDIRAEYDRVITTAYAAGFEAGKKRKPGGEIMEKREAEHGSGLLLDGYKITTVHLNNGGSHHIYGKDQAHTIYSDNFSGVVIISDDGNCMDLIPMTSIEQISFESVEEEA